MFLRVFTWIHVAISLVAIIAGFVAVAGFLTNNFLDGWTLVFLITTVLTSVTGFGFPFEKFLPSHALGIISLIFLAVAIVGRYSFHMEGTWRWVFVVTAVLSLYFNFFVLIVQSFQKLSLLKAKAPTQKEPPFVISQLVALLAFVCITIASVLHFHP